MSSSDHETAQSLVEQGREHYRLQRPLAAWASWRRALGFVPDFAPALEALEGLEQAPQLPEAARTPLRFEPPGTPTRRKHWDKAFKTRDLQDLADAADAFATLAEDDDSDDAAWFNHGVCLAWLGRNIDAIAAFRHVVRLRCESQFDQAVTAWTLAEVLRHGAGAETVADDFAYAWTLECDEATAQQWLTSWPAIQPVAGPADPGATPVPLAFTWLDRPLPDARGDLQLQNVPRVLAQILKFPGTVRLSSPDSAMLDQVCGQLTTAFGDGMRPLRREAIPLPLPLLDAALWNFRLPPGLDGDVEQRLRRAAVEHYHEDVWIHESRRSVDGMTPRDASRAAREGNAILRAQLAAVVRFREQLGERPWTANLYQGYPFDRLRRRLDLGPTDPESVDPSDIPCMGVIDLERLVPADLDESRLIEAYESASALRVDRVSAGFAAELTRRRSASLGRLDTPSVIAPLVREAMNAHHSDEALDWLDQARGLNAGRDQRTFDVWSAEILARSGDPDGALEVYEQLLANDPSNVRLALDAVETLLDNGYSEHARPLLTRTVELARQVGDRAVAERAATLLQGGAAEQP